MPPSHQPIKPKGSRLSFGVVIGMIVLVDAAILTCGYFFFQQMRQGQGAPDSGSVSQMSAPEDNFNGNDTLPSGLPAPNPLFAAAAAPSDPHIFEHAAMSPPMPDYNQVAAQIERMPWPAAPPAVTTSPTATVASESGLIVFDPVVSGPSNASTVNFGVGCGNWLHLEAAGNPSLGRTPLWDDRDRVGQELKVSNLQLTPDQCKQVLTMTGASDVACGKLSVNPTTYTLTYQIYALPDLKPVGAAISQTGSQAIIAASLPRMAQELDTDLGVTAPAPQSPVGLSAGELATLGGLIETQVYSFGDLNTLDSMSRKSPLARLLLLNSSACDDQIVLLKTVSNLLVQLPDNALVISQIGYTFPNQLRTRSSVIEPLITKYSGCSLLAHTEVWEQRSWGDPVSEYVASNRLVNDSPFDPQNWLSHSYTVSNVASEIRGGRFASDISASDWALITPLYKGAIRDDSFATGLDPLYGHAWFEYAVDAGYANTVNNRDLLKKAEGLDPSLLEVYYQELQFFQPKWNDTPADLDATALAASTTNYDDVSSATSIAGELSDIASATSDSKYTVMESSLMNRTVDKLRAEVAANPTNPFYQWSLGTALAFYGDRHSAREAILHFRIAAHFLPNSSSLHYELAEALYAAADFPDHLTELHRALQLDPFNYDAQIALADTLKMQGHYGEAMPEMIKADRLYPESSQACFGLGILYSVAGNNSLAVKENDAAVKIDPYYVMAWVHLCSDLDTLGHYKASLDAGQHAISSASIYSDNDTEALVDAHDTMADDYLHLKNWSASLDQTNAALSLDPSDACAQENLAEAYWGQGDKAKAIAQWQVVSAANDPQVGPVARQFLTKYDH